jgi:hypothetical protein
VIVTFSKYQEVTFENVLIFHFLMPVDKQNKQIYVERLLILSTRGVIKEVRRKRLKMTVSGT